MRRKKKSKILLGLLIAVITLGIGYAAIAGVNLLVNGTAAIKSSDGNFFVRFVKPIASETAIENPVESAITISGHNADDSLMDVSGMSASVEDDTHATFNAGSLDEVGEYVEFTYTVVNESNGIDTMLSFDIADENDGEDYFEITKSVTKSVISNGETANVTVKVKLINRPVVDDFNATFTITLTANPVEKEDLSESTVGSTSTVGSPATLAKAIQSSSVDTIELSNDITITNNTPLTVREDTTLDFNGHTLTVEPGNIKVSNGAELTLQDEDGTGGIKSTNNAIIVDSESELTVESGTYETTEFTGRGAVIRIPEGIDNAKVTINGGTINGKYFAVAS